MTTYIPVNLLMCANIYIYIYTPTNCFYYRHVRCVSDIAATLCTLLVRDPDFSQSESIEVRWSNNNLVFSFFVSGVSKDGWEPLLTASQQELNKII